MTNNTRTLCFQFTLTIHKMKVREKKTKKKEQNEEKDEIINNNIINNNKEENGEDDENMENKLKSLEKIRKERRNSPKNIFEENKKIPLLSNLKINNKTPIPNSKNLNESSTFLQISNEQPLQPIYNQIPIYYNPLMQEVMNYPTESQIMALQPQEFVNIRQTQNKLTYLGKLLMPYILSRLIILILLICLYGWLTYDFYDANGFTLRATTDLFCMATGVFIVLCYLIIQNILRKFTNLILIINKFKFYLIKTSCCICQANVRRTFMDWEFIWNIHKLDKSYQIFLGFLFFQF